MFFIILFTVFLCNSSTILFAADQDFSQQNENSKNITSPRTGSTNNPPMLPIGNPSLDDMLLFFAQSVPTLRSNTPSNLFFSIDSDEEKVKNRREKRKRQKSSSMQSAEEGTKKVTEYTEYVAIDTLDASNLPIWLKSQLYLQNRALAYQEQRSQAEVNLKEDLDLWAILVRREICKKAEHRKTLDWVKELTLANGSGLEGTIGQFNAELSEYERNIALFCNKNPYNENEMNFMLWFTSLPERQDREMSDEKLLKWFTKIEKTLFKVSFSYFPDLKTETLKQKLCRKWLNALPLDAGPQSDIKRAIAQATHMEIQRYKLIQLQERLEDFYKEQFDALPPITAEGIIDFALQPVNLGDSHLTKFMEGKHEKNEGVEEHPIGIEEVTSMMHFIQTHQELARKYISEILL